MLSMYILECQPLLHCLLLDAQLDQYSLSHYRKLGNYTLNAVDFPSNATNIGPIEILKTGDERAGKSAQYMY
jgi:hypothetical protein